jgi:hypothetical protein
MHGMNIMFILSCDDVASLSILGMLVLRPLDAPFLTWRHTFNCRVVRVRFMLD